MATDLPSVALLLTISMEIILLTLSTLRWTLMTTIQYLTTWFVTLNIFGSLGAISFYCMAAWQSGLNLLFARSISANNMTKFFAFVTTGSSLLAGAHTFCFWNFRAFDRVYMTTNRHLQRHFSPAWLTLFDTLITQVGAGVFAQFFSFTRFSTFEGFMTVLVVCSYLKWMAEVLTAVTTVKSNFAFKLASSFRDILEVLNLLDLSHYFVS